MTDYKDNTGSHGRPSLVVRRRLKVMLAYPPLESDKGTPLLAQNRQFQWFKSPTYIYPVVPAQAATLLKNDGFDVVWADGIAESMTYQEWLDLVKSEKPDIIAMETKTPVVKRHWRIIEDIKSTDDRRPTTGPTVSAVVGKQSSVVAPLVVLFGDHVTALPEESMQNSKVDFILTGGDYDFLLLELCQLLSTVDRRQSTDLSINHQPSTINFPPGIWYREGSEIRNTGPFKLDHNLDDIPFIDRELTKWNLYAYKNGNFKRTPGTYIMSGRDCWWGKCSFCSWPTLYPKFRRRSATNVLDEIGELIGKYGVKEIMDDTGTFPTGSWLREFCEGMIKRGYNKQVQISCNMRFGVLSFEEYRLMKKAGFRFILFGLESANQTTLDRINKNVKTEDIIESCRIARKSGLYPHITIMFGYPWESREDAARTLELGSYLLKKGFAYTVQATIVIPYPGSKLFAECEAEGSLRTTDWDLYGMKEPVMKTSVHDAEIMRFVQGIYGVAYNPEFIARRLASLRDFSDLKYFLKAGGRVIGHLFDFRPQNDSC